MVERGAGKHYTLKAKITGPERTDETETEFLGRSIRWTSEGIIWEADEKHVENLLQEHGMTMANPVGTPITPDIYVDKGPGDREKTRENG